MQEKVGQALEKAKIPYMIIGGMAVLEYGSPRFTHDVDLSVGVLPAAYEQMVAALKTQGIEPRIADAEKLLRRSMVLLCVDRATGVAIDLAFTDSPYELQAMQRARKVRRHGKIVRLATAEDLIIHKMVSSRPQDRQDIEGILLRQKKLDWHYIEDWLGQFEEALDRPLREEWLRLRMEVIGKHSG